MSEVVGATASGFELLERHAAAIENLCRQYGVRSLRVFGSAVQGTARPDSDLDLLVTFARPTSLLGLVRLERELSALLGVDVDLVTERALSPYLRASILEEARAVYEQA